MNETMRDKVGELARKDGEQAVGIVVRFLVHELRNAINPLGMQLAILRLRLRTPNDELEAVIGGLHESLDRVQAVLDRAAQLGHELAPDGDDRDLREPWQRG